MSAIEQSALHCSIFILVAQALEELDFFIKETDRKMEIAKKKQEESNVDVSEEVKEMVGIGIWYDTAMEMSLL